MATATYAELKRQSEELAEKAEEARLRELEGVIAELRVKIEEYNLTPDQLFKKQRARRGEGVKKASILPPKYRNPKTGDEWSGRGRKPAWFAEMTAAQQKRALIKNDSEVMDS